MTDEVTIQGVMRGGEMKLLQRDYMVSIVRQWPDGAPFALTATLERPKVSDLQRGYWFAVVVPLVAEFTGDDEDSTHEDLKALFFPKITKVWRNKKTGKRRRRTKRLSIMDFNTKQMTELIDRTRQWAMDFCEGLDIPAPDPQWRVRRGKAA